MGRGGCRKEGAGKAAGEPGVSTEAKTEFPRLAVYLWHSGEAELGIGLFILHAFPPNPFQRALWNPSDKFPRV